MCGGVHSSRNHAVCKSKLHQHRAKVGDVLHLLLGYFLSYALVGAQLHILIDALLEMG